ncbi:hypothetical protein FisN_3Lh335 [Fistulifera solaris]|uniref:Uncharacterized protein n=1 Tax=Fistulifera solaris TaxID=1519565 RepID=A0A1Z5J8B0_FISSO|nr:hypothetical protein FisN_3Lh335 [Fistulifera solaris]|eukprot:GAX10142.1 hypothetical protein FisN_3Lh335 [Fistulifera solaris]
MSSAMSCVSETQRSDLATVCSNSIAEDIELESVLSQEDQHTALVAQHSPVGSRRVTRARLVEFTATAAIMSHQFLPNAALASGEGTSSFHNNMGPPLSRSLLQQKVDGSHMRISSTNSVKSTSSVKSFGSHTGSEVMSKLRLDDCSGSLEDEMISSKAVLTSSRPSSVKSFGSAGTDDCSGSLDVETHSIETKSVHSQEDTFNADPDAGKESEPDEHKMSGVVAEDVSTNEGRMSPGGTLYKGKGSFRYKGRFMHLPLMRFHHGGVHLDMDQEDGNARQIIWMCDNEPGRRSARSSPLCEESLAMHDPRRDAELIARYHGIHDRVRNNMNAHGGSYMTRARSRSRSRSRSPTKNEQRPYESDRATLQPILSGPSDSRSDGMSRAKLN